MTRWMRSLFVRIPLACLLLALAAVPASADETITLISDQTLDADGSTLWFSWRGDIWSVSSEGGVARQITRHPADDRAPYVSPDGTTLAFVSDREGSNQIYTLSLTEAGAEPKRITWHTTGWDLYGWYSTGEHLLAMRGTDNFWRRTGRLFSVPVSGEGAPKMLANAYGYDGRLSPDDSTVLARREGRQWWRQGYRGPAAAEIWSVDTNSGEFTKLLKEDTDCRYPMWKSDGTGFWFVGDVNGTANLRWYSKADGSTKPVTTYTDDPVLIAAASRDSGTIVFRKLFDLYRFRPGVDTQPKKITITCNADFPTPVTHNRNLNRVDGMNFSADGLEVVFTAGGDVWVMDTVLREPVQITNTPEEEREPLFSPDGKEVWFVRDANGQPDIWKAVRADENTWWWQNESFTLTQITKDPEEESNLDWSPDGKLLAYVRGRGDLHVMKADGTDSKRLVQSWNGPGYSWSPDSKWLVYSLSDDDFNRDIWLLPIDGSREPFNLSQHPDNEYDPVWSPDGRIIAFFGRRFDDEYDIFFVWLRKEDEQQSGRDRKLQEALEKMQKARPAPKAPEGEGGEGGANGDGNGNGNGGNAGGDAEKEEDKGLTIDFDRIHERIHRVRVSGTPGGLFWSPDSKRLAFQSENATWTISFPDELSPKKITSLTGSFANWTAKGSKIFWKASNNLPAVVNVRGSNLSQEVYTFGVRQTLDLPEYRRAAFDMVWRTMRDHYYDGRLGNNNWDAVRRKYSDAAASAPTNGALGEVINMMLGELNGSHLGYSAPRDASWSTGDQWRDETPHLGLRFDDGWNGPGLKVRDVITDGPADQEDDPIHAGEIVMAIDGTPVDPAMNLAKVLNGPLDREIELSVRNAENEDRTVTIRPVSWNSIFGLLYNQWVRDTRKQVEEASGGRLGYMHIRGMNWPSFQQFEAELYSAGAGKDGIVIDVRNNGGGFTTDHLLTVLCQPHHAWTVPRGGGAGYPHDRRVYACWHKPIIVLCNQNSFSNAEIFAHAIKNLGRGQVVGVQTAGGVISTGSASIRDMGRIRMPFRAWFLPDGEDMELNGCMPHHVIWPLPGEMPAGVDNQLKKAVEVLLADCDKDPHDPPKFRYAHERD